MKKVEELKLGFVDAVNYSERQNKSMFNDIFIKDDYLENLLKPNVYYLIGEKGTGKTAYAVYMANNNYKETKSQLKFLRETDYKKFMLLKNEKHIAYSDYENIWKVILLLLISRDISPSELSLFQFNKTKKIEAINNAIDEYYYSAFAPEISNALSFVNESSGMAEVISKYFKMGGEEKNIFSFSESKFQINLMYIQRKFEDALSDLKLKNNHYLFIDGIDIRPEGISYSDYLECVKGLANAIWSLNTDFFSNIKDSKGRFKVVLLLRPDIFCSLGMQNLSNKLRDNSVYLDWRTTYTEYRTSRLFKLCDRLLEYQQDEKLSFGQVWDMYFPWRLKPTSPKRPFDEAFMAFLRISYSRPRDLVTIMQLLQDEHIKRPRSGINSYEFLQIDFESDSFKNKYSEYLMASLKDQIAFYYSEEDYNLFLKFLAYFEGKGEFDYTEYVNMYNKFLDYVLEYAEDLPEFIESPGEFLQFLYDLNIICYIDEGVNDTYFRWCYRERCYSNISPKVKLNAKYRVHYGLYKILSVYISKK